ncbi:MAG TPA: protease complex subunit PrcB family protein, partial [Firmicutes bacterium]|nr:protease complex subunit PrcB family protein [Bacillota bacterium]
MFRHKGYLSKAWLSLCFIMFALWGCTRVSEFKSPLPTPTLTLPGESLEWDKVYNEPTSPHKESYPTMKIIVDQKQAFELEKSLQLPPHLRTLHTLDFDKFFLIIVFQGEKPTTRYSVEVVDVRRAGNVITVYARFLTPPTPAPGEIVGVGNIVTSPY